MSQRTLLRLLGAAAVLVTVWILVTAIGGRGGADRADADELSAVLDGITPESITGVRVAGGLDPVELVRTGESWTVNGWPADSGLVAGFLSALDGAAVVDLVARNPDNHGRMGVAADSTNEVSIEIGGNAVSLLVGKAGPGFGTAFVRLPDRDAVHLMDGGIRSHVVRTADAWRDKRVIAVDTTAVAHVSIGRDEGEFALSRADSTWTLGDGASADATAVRNLLSELADLRATGFLNAQDSIAMLPAEVTIAAASASGDTLAILTAGEGEVDRWVRSSGDSVIYRVAGWRIDRLAPTRESVTGES